MSKIFQFGENVPGYTIPVLNEREIRAGAGILFVLMFIAITQAGGQGNFTLLKYAITIFLFDFLIRVFINPKFAPILILSRWIVRNQTPEYVGATQKKFAWIIGLVLAITMLILAVIMNTYSPITGLICFICLIFLFFESAFGICIGCYTYKWIYKEKAQYCPGEVCDIKSRHEIQKTNFKQWLIVLALVGFILASVYAFHDFYKQRPLPLWGPDVLQEEINKRNAGH